MKKVEFILLTIFIVIVSSCATTKLSSFKNPEIDLTLYKSIVVFANIKDIEIRKYLENKLVEEFTTRGKNAVSYISLFSPLKEYSTEKIINTLKEKNIGCYLEISIMDAKNNSAYVPQKTTTHYQSQYVNGQYISTPYTTTSGGYSVSYPTASFEITALDLQSGEVAMKATANSEGDEFSDMKTIMTSLTKKIVDEFVPPVKAYGN